MAPQARRSIALVAALAAVRLALTALVLRLGLSAISDDDYARVTIAQAFAASPRLDPSGTSWLPLPFWITGACMAIFSDSLSTARAVAFALAAAATGGLFLAVRASGSSRRAAFAAAVASALMPVSALTGAATVPELPTAVLCASALLLLRRTDRRALLAAAACVLPATLSRYESWPVAGVVAATAWIGRRKRDDGPPLRLADRVTASLVALAGVAGWLAWNRFAHGEALHFHGRVSAFWVASGHAREEALLQLLSGYPWTAVAGVPVLSTLVLGAVWVAPHRAVLATWARPVAGAVVVVAALTAMQATGGAPTHHPERTLMLVWMVAWALCMDLFERSGALDRFRLGAVAAAGIVVTLLLQQTIASVQDARNTQADRGAETRVGAWIRAHAPAATVLIDPVDYGYFAIIAAAGSPARFALSHSIDPRAAPSASPLLDETALRHRIAQTGSTLLVVRGDRMGAAEIVGSREANESGWAILRVRAP